MKGQTGSQQETGARCWLLVAGFAFILNLQPSWAIFNIGLTVEKASGRKNWFPAESRGKIQGEKIS
jgi:hypothetical protein